MPESTSPKIAILGGGSLGCALARGWVNAGICAPGDIWITRRHADKLSDMATEGFRTGSDSVAAISDAEIVVLAVQPTHLAGLAAEIHEHVQVDEHLLISVLTGVSLDDLSRLFSTGIKIVRAMPNTAVQTMSSMTCIATDSKATGQDIAIELFNAVGRSMVIDEDMMTPATAVCACGIAFFLRTVRAAAQGGTEIGFHAEDALLLAAQTARGAADLVLQNGAHPEDAIDQVTTPRGCTIAGLNELEHRGFSSAMIRGILTSSRRAEELL